MEKGQTVGYSLSWGIRTPNLASLPSLIASLLLNIQRLKLMIL